MNLISILKEIFDNPYSFSGPSRKGMGIIEYKFKSKNNLDYIVYFDMQYSRNEKTDQYEWNTSVSYETKQKGLELTGEGDIQVLSTVIAIVKNFIEKYKPNKISYDGLKEKEEIENPEELSKRAKVYKATINKLKSDVPEYEVSYDGDTGVLTRKEPIDHKKGIYKVPDLDKLAYGIF